jgi:hypothetical protein
MRATYPAYLFFNDPITLIIQLMKLLIMQFCSTHCHSSPFNSKSVILLEVFSVYNIDFCYRRAGQGGEMIKWWVDPSSPSVNEGCYCDIYSGAKRYEFWCGVIV